MENKREKIYNSFDSNYETTRQSLVHSHAPHFLTLVFLTDVFHKS